MGAQSLLEAQAGRVLEFLNTLGVQVSSITVRQRIDGAHVNSATFFDPTNPGTAVIIAVLAGFVTIADVRHNVTPSPIANMGTIPWSDIAGRAVVMSVVLNAGALNDNPAVASVLGVETTQGNEQSPSDVGITLSLGHSNWVRLADITIVRLAAAGEGSSTFAIDNSVREPLEVEVETSGSSPNLSVDEDEFNG